MEGDFPISQFPNFKIDRYRQELYFAGMKNKNVLLCLLLVLPFAASAQKENYLIVGTYTGGKSEGIYVYKFNSGDGTHKEVSHDSLQSFFSCCFTR